MLTILMMLQKTEHTESAFCNDPRLQRAAMPLQQMLKEKTALVRAASEAVKTNKNLLYQEQKHQQNNW